MKNTETPECLKYAGLMGHRWIVTHMHNGKEEVRAETNSYRSTFEAYFEFEDSHAIYQRTKKGWKRIR